MQCPCSRQPGNTSVGLRGFIEESTHIIQLSLPVSTLLSQVAIKEKKSTSRYKLKLFLLTV